VRSQVLSLKESEFVEAAKTLGLNTFHIVFREMLPNISSYVVTNFPYQILEAMAGSVGLIMLGLMAIDINNWGFMINEYILCSALTIPEVSWRLLTLFSPIMATLLLTLGLVLLFDGLETVFNPRLQEE